MGDLLLLTLCETIIAATQFNYVLGQFTWHLCRSSFFVLIGTIKPEVNFFEHLVNAEAMLEYKHLLQRSHR